MISTSKKDRFEELYVFAESDPSKFPEVAKEMLDIYRALKQENLQLIEQYKDQLKISNLHIDKIVELTKEIHILKRLLENINNTKIKLEKENIELTNKFDRWTKDIPCSKMIEEDSFK